MGKLTNDNAKVLKKPKMIGGILPTKPVTPGSAGCENKMKKRSLEPTGKQMANDLVSPPAKKMKQARLPFAPKMSPNNCMTKTPSPRPSTTTVSPELKKRRISDENSPPTPLSVVPSKSKMAGRGTKSPVRPTVIIIEDEEQVPSSSSEVATPPSKSRSTPSKPASSLDGFLQTTQQPQVTTSDSTVIDLTDESENNLDSSTSSAQSPDSSDSEEEGEEGDTTEEQMEPDRLVDQSDDAAPTQSSGTPTQSVHTTVGKKVKSQKALQKEKEKQNQREEKARIREERKKKLEAEKAAKQEKKRATQLQRQLETEAAQREKEARRAERQARRAREEQDREEKRRLKQEERQKKQSLQDALQAEKRKKQEEKEKMESERKREMEEANKKNQKQQMMFKSFFKKQSPDSTPIANDQYEVCGPFPAFQLRKDMVIAPTLRTTKMKSEEVKQQFEEIIHQVQRDASCNYLQALSSGDIIAGRSGRTRGSRRSIKDETEQDDVQEVRSVADSSNLTQKAKLFQFHENHRPAYYGTWRKTSKKISGRRPLLKDEDLLDYEVDSDDEWEDPGESLSDSGSEDEDDSDGGDESDDGFFVPHGYLSEDEDEGAAEDDKETWEKRRAAKAKDWDNEMKRKTEQLKTILIGCTWIASAKSSEESAERLRKFKAVPLMSIPILLTGVSSPRARTRDENGTEKKQVLAAGNKIRPVPKEAMPDLIRLVHGNMAGIKNLCKEFREFWKRKNSSSSGADGAPGLPVQGGSDPTGQTVTPLFRSAEDFVISKRQLEKKISKIAVRDKRDGFGKIVWYVHEQVLKEYKMENTPIPSEWVFLTRKPYDPTRPTSATPSPAPSPAPEVTTRSPPENKGGLFAMFTPVMSGKSAAATLKSLATSASNQSPVTPAAPLLAPRAVLPKPSQSVNNAGPQVKTPLLLNCSSTTGPVLPRPAQSTTNPGPQVKAPLLLNSSSAPQLVLRRLPQLMDHSGAEVQSAVLTRPPQSVRGPEPQIKGSVLQSSSLGLFQPPSVGEKTTAPVIPRKIGAGIMAYLPSQKAEDDDCVVVE